MNPTAQPPLVQFNAVRFGYAERPILDGLTLALPRGRVTAVLGASGGGKTTLLRLIGGQQRAQSGQVLFDGQEVGALGNAVSYTHLTLPTTERV